MLLKLRKLVYLLVSGILLVTGSMADPALAQTIPNAGQTVYIPIIQNGPAAAGSNPTTTPTPASTVAQTAQPTQPAPTTGVTPGHDPVLVAAGDIARCGFPGAQETAGLLAKIPGTVAALGDNAYDAGSAADYANCYGPTWGQFKSSTRPAAGNHDYLTANAAGYFKYFGAAAGAPSKGYYSYNLGAWHIVVINSNCSKVGFCRAGSPQEQWLRADLKAHPAKCTLAYWHHPFFSSGQFGGWAMMRPIWQALYDAGAEIVLSGHDHDYERFAPQNTAGSLDTARGITQFVVGTGGGNFTPLVPPLKPNSRASVENTYGVLKLTLHATSYTWEFVPVAGSSFNDTGTANCH